MLLWPDYWKSTVAPDFLSIASEARLWEGAPVSSHRCPPTPHPLSNPTPPAPPRPPAFSVSVSPEPPLHAPPHRTGLDRAAGSVETGQLVVQKRACWAPLLLALFLNLQGSLYYTLLTN